VQSGHAAHPGIVTTRRPCVMARSLASGVGLAGEHVLTVRIHGPWRTRPACSRAQARTEEGWQRAMGWLTGGNHVLQARWSMGGSGRYFARSYTARDASGACHTQK
jgi:hypothetical protein